MESGKKNTHRIEHWQVINACLIVYDIITINLSYLAALWIRFDCHYSSIPAQYLKAFLDFAPLYTILCLVIYWLFRLYNSIWRFASFVELIHAIVATMITGLIHIIGITFCYNRMPISYYIIGILLQFGFTIGVRFAYRLVILLRHRMSKDNRKDGNNVMLIGAGAAGRMILRDVNKSEETKDRVVCIIDDNPNKWGRYIDGVKVVGGRESIPEAVKEHGIHKILMAIPTATPEQKSSILNICKETGCELKTLPGIYQLANGEVTVGAMKDVAIEDLLGRDPIKVDMTEIYSFLQGKTILVTGGGGSIGSELCRQIASHNPKQLIIFDIYENNAYAIQQELKWDYPNLNLVVLIGSVRDSRRISYVFETYKPDVVYHAAAHKHVPLMEDSPFEAIKNNVFGTYKTAYAAMMNSCQRFVLISTDKAVNPTNIMGASKRLCEMIIQSFDKKIKENREKDLPLLHAHMEDEDGSMFHLAPEGSYRVDENGNPTFTIPGQDGLGHRKAQTEFVAVRFGNVLGSNGSVIPLFKNQIKAGGPVTVTHPDIIRYFMTIPEAVSLVLQAGTYAKGGEIFVLDMGEPVKIDTLARNLIKLSGYKPDVDIKIEYTGLRPGEKLYEEKLMAEEGLKTTANKLIHIGCPIPFDTDEFLNELQPLMKASYEGRGDIREMVKGMVSTYHPAENK